MDESLAWQKATDMLSQSYHYLRHVHEMHHAYKQIDLTHASFAKQNVRLSDTFLTRWYKDSIMTIIDIYPSI